MSLGIIQIEDSSILDIELISTWLQFVTRETERETKFSALVLRRFLENRLPYDSIDKTADIDFYYSVIRFETNNMQLYTLESVGHRHASGISDR